MVATRTSESPEQQLGDKAERQLVVTFSPRVHAIPNLARLVAAERVVLLPDNIGASEVDAVITGPEPGSATAARRYARRRDIPFDRVA